MPTDSLFEVLKKELSGIYGPAEGMRKTMVMTPGILADFQGMLDRAAAGRRITEEYKVEDGKCRIVLGGIKDASGGRITEATVIAFGRENHYNIK